MQTTGFFFLQTTGFFLNSVMPEGHFAATGVVDSGSFKLRRPPCIFYLRVAFRMRIAFHLALAFRAGHFGDEHAGLPRVRASFVVGTLASRVQMNDCLATRASPKDQTMCTTYFQMEYAGSVRFTVIQLFVLSHNC